MRKSKADTADTRKRIVAVASKMFLEQGLGATGIADVMTAAGLTQGGFYRHFDSKEQLVAEANASALERLGEMLQRETEGKPVLDALDTIIRIYLYQLQVEDAVYLCPLANLGSELRHADAQVKAVVNGGYAGFVKLLATYTRQLAVDDPDGLADAILATMVGAVTLSRLAVDKAAAMSILDNARNTIHLLLKRG